VYIQIEGGNTNPGIRSLLAGEIDLAGAGRHLIAEEKQRGLVAHFLGWEVLTVVVQRTNPVDALTIAPLRGIFAANVSTGRYALAKPLALVTRGEPKGQLERFIKFALSPRGQGVLSKSFVPGAKP